MSACKILICTCAYMFTYIYIYIYICIVCRCTHIEVQIHTCIHTYIHTYTYTYIYICMCIYIFVYMCIYVWMYMYIHMSLCLDTYIYIWVCTRMSITYSQVHPYAIRRAEMPSFRAGQSWLEPDPLSRRTNAPDQTAHGISGAPVPWRSSLVVGLISMEQSAVQFPELIQLWVLKGRRKNSQELLRQHPAIPFPSLKTASVLLKHCNTNVGKPINKTSVSGRLQLRPSKRNTEKAPETLRGLPIPSRYRFSTTTT